MPGTLFVVATPIGNLEDITLRALRILREADWVAAEDTRRTANLLAHHGITARVVSFHEHNIRARLPQLIGRLRDGGSVALVTDAGTPGISDPGVQLVHACREEGIAVDVVPGPSAPIAAAVLSGFPLVPLTIHGFAPARSKDRIAWLNEISAAPHTQTFFEAPHRILQTLADARDIFGERPIAIAREMTKLHQEVLSGTAGSIAKAIKEPRGEFTAVVGPAERAAVKRPQARAGDEALLNEFGQMTLVGGRRAAVSAVARKFGMHTRDVYSAIERAKEKQSKPDRDGT